MSRNTPTVRDTLDHWHHVTATANGAMETHGVWLTKPVSVEPGTSIVAQCANPLCFHAAFVAVGIENLTRLGMQANEHMAALNTNIELIGTIVQRKSGNMPFVLPS